AVSAVLDVHARFRVCTRLSKSIVITRAWAALSKAPHSSETRTRTATILGVLVSVFVSLAEVQLSGQRCESPCLFDLVRVAAVSSRDLVEKAMRVIVVAKPELGPACAVELWARLEAGFVLALVLDVALLLSRPANLVDDLNVRELVVEESDAP